MGSIISKTWITIISLVLSMSLGFWLLKNGKPYSQAISTLHKVTSIIAGIGFGIIAYGMLKDGGAVVSAKIFLALTVVFFVISVASGSVLITIKNTNALILITHRILPFLTYLFGLLSIYFLIKH